MNEMYDLSLMVHAVTVWFFMSIPFINILLTMRDISFSDYEKQIQFLVPIFSGLLAVLILTGALMMAAKHLEFTFANNVMIVTSLLFMGLEGMRFGRLKKVRDGMLSKKTYRQLAMKIYVTQLLLISAVVSAAMFYS